MIENRQNRVTWGDLTIFSAVGLNNFNKLGA